MGRWNLDTSTQAGKDIKKQAASIPTVSSSEPGRITKDKWEFFDLKSRNRYVEQKRRSQTT